jgi:thioredoxin-like negative regulator of GroEL
MEILTSKNYRNEIIDAETRNKLIYFWGEDCIHCKENYGVVANLENKYKTISFYKINSKENMKLTLELKIRNIPTILLYKGSNLIKLVNSFEIKPRLEDYIKKYLL